MQYSRDHMRRPGPRWNQGQARQQNCSVQAGPDTNASSSVFQQLQECREELARQKGLKEMFINREKATRDEMERLKRASNPETMITFGIASQARTTIKTKKKKDLQMEYENMKTSYVILEHKFSSQLQLEREEKQTLLDELEQLKLQLKSNQIHEEEHADKISEKEALEKKVVALEFDINTLKDNLSENDKTHFKDLEDLKEQLQTKQGHEMELKIEVKSMSEEKQTLLDELEQLKLQLKSNQIHEEEHADKISEKEALEKKVVALEFEIITLKNNASKTEKNGVKFLNDLKHKHVSSILAHTTKLHAEEEVSQALRTQLSQLKEENADKISETEALQKKVVALEFDINTLKDNLSENDKTHFKDLEDLKEQLQTKQGHEMELKIEVKSMSEEKQTLLDELEQLKLQLKSNQIHEEEHADKISEKEALQKKVVALEFEIITLKNNASETEKDGVKFLNDLKHKHVSSILAHTTKLHAEEEVSQNLRTQLSQLKEENTDKISEKEALQKKVVALEFDINTLKDNLSANDKTHFKDLEDLKEQLQTKQGHEMELKIEVKSMSKDLEATKQLMAEKDLLVHHMKKQIQTLEDDASEKKTYFKHLEGLNEPLASTNKEQETNAETSQTEENLHHSPNVDVLKDSEGKKKVKLSYWKKFKRSIGFGRNPAV
ncbi:uncharacterized protein LOC144388961 [Gasterosteus aculeatus]